jgi:hypothetical protein
MTTAENRQAFTRKVTDILQCYLGDRELEVAVVALDEAAIFYTDYAPAWRRTREGDRLVAAYAYSDERRRAVLLLTQGQALACAPTGELLPVDADDAAADFVEHACSARRPMTITATGITKVCVRYRRDDE